MNKKLTKAQQCVLEYQSLCNRLGWPANSLSGQGQDIAKVKVIVAEFDPFFRRWLGRTGHPEVETFLATFELAFRQTRREVEEAYLADLLRVLLARGGCLEAERRVRATPKLVRMMKAGQKRGGRTYSTMLRMYRRATGEDYDPVRDFRKMEAEADAQEKVFRQRLAELEVDWPERVSPAMRRRLRQVKYRALITWTRREGQTLQKSWRHSARFKSTKKMKAIAEQFGQ